MKYLIIISLITSIWSCSKDATEETKTGTFMFHLHTYIDNAKPLDGFTNIASKDIKNSVLVYPNPTNNFVIIKATEDFGLATIKIYDINGNIVISEQHNMVENNVINIDVSKLLIGYYSICVSVNDKEQWSNFVKK